MKTLSKFFLMLAGATMLFSCEKEDKGPNIVDMEHHYKMVYMLGGATNHWDSADPLPMKKTDDPDIFEYEIDLVRNAENKLIKFSISVDTWDKAEFLVPAKVEEDKAYAFLKEGINDLCITSVKKDGEGKLKDHFFGINKGQSGKYLLRVNPVKLTLEAKKLSPLEDEEVIEWVEGTVYMVGDATPAGWQIASPTPMVRNGNIHTYEGILKVGEMKFPTEFAWEKPTYMPEVNGTVINKDGVASNKVVLMPEGQPDNKWKVEEEGKYRITLDTEALTINVEWLGEK